MFDTEHSLPYDNITKIMFILQGYVGRLMTILAMTFTVERCRMHGSKPGGRRLHKFLIPIVTMTKYINY